MSFLKCGPAVDEIWVYKTWSEVREGRTIKFYQHTALDIHEEKDQEQIERLVKLVDKSEIEDQIPVVSSLDYRYSVSTLNGSDSAEDSVTLIPPYIWLPDGSIGRAVGELQDFIEQLVSEGEIQEFDFVDFIENYVAFEPVEALHS